VNKSFEELHFGGLRISVIHHLVKELVDDNKIVSNRLLLKILEVVFEDADEGVQKSKYHDCVVVLPGDGNQVQIVMLVEVEKVIFFVLD
jgi:hypothetical protein